MTVDGETSHLAAGTAGHIVSGAGCVLANPARAETAFPTSLVCVAVFTAATLPGRDRSDGESCQVLRSASVGDWRAARRAG
jgi:hypothetical protein